MTARTGLKPIDELILLAQGGNGLAFTALWDRHIDRLRRYVKNRIKGIDAYGVDVLADQTDDALNSLIRTESEEEREKYIDGLPELYREVARKRLMDGMKYNEIAECLDLELNTVKTRIRRAKQMINEARRQDEEAEP